MENAYTIQDLINELSMRDPNEPVLVAYWTPKDFDLTNERFVQCVDELDLQNWLVGEDLVDEVWLWIDEKWIDEKEKNN